MMRNIAIVALVALTAPACVSKGKYDTLDKRFKNTQAQLGERGETIKTLEEALASDQAKVTSLSNDVAKLDQQIKNRDQQVKRHKGEQARLEGELTAVVKDRSRLKASAKEMKQALAELNERKAQAEGRVSQYRALLTRFKNMIDAGKLRVTIADGRMVLALPTDVLFASGKARLSKEGRQAIVEVAKVLSTIPDRKFQIEGHTDNVPIKTAKYPSNWDLAAARALVVVKAMTKAGMKGDLLSAASFGEYRAVSANDTSEGRTRNRRIEIVLMPDLSTLPGFGELKSAVDAN